MGSTPGLVPGANSSGLQVNLPFAPQQGGQATLGGTINPLLPINTGGAGSFGTMPQGPVSTSASSGFPANTGAGTSGPIAPITGGAPGAPGTSAGNMGMPQLSQHDKGELFKNLEKTYGAGVAQLMINFLNGGAGYNPQVLQNLIAQLQPQFERGQQNLMQQFSAGGSRFGSGAEVGMADLISQQNLEVGSIAAKLYEDSVNNFIGVLMGAGGADAHRIATTQSFWDQFVQMVTGNVNKMNQAAAAAAAGG